MFPEPAVFILDERLQIARRHVGESHRITPDALRIGKAPERRAVLELIGVGYRAQLQGKKLVLNVGYSHPVEIEAPAGIEIEVPSNTSVIVKGSDKEVVGELAANIRGLTTIVHERKCGT